MCALTIYFPPFSCVENGNVGRFTSLLAIKKKLVFSHPQFVHETQYFEMYAQRCCVHQNELSQNLLFPFEGNSNLIFQLKESRFG
jgi:hypothetical protein